MDLYLIRHCKASDDYDRDEERGLTASGRESATDVGKALKKEGVKFSRIISSPLVRAVQTAELIAVATGYEDEIIIDRALGPDGKPSKMLEAAAEYADEESVALVGHEPSMGQCASKLLDKGSLSLRKGAVLRLKWSPDEKAELVWVLSPKHLEPDRSGLELL